MPRAMRVSVSMSESLSTPTWNKPRLPSLAIAWSFSSKPPTTLNVTAEYTVAALLHTASTRSCVNNRERDPCNAVRSSATLGFSPFAKMASICSTVFRKSAMRFWHAWTLYGTSADDPSTYRCTPPTTWHQRPRNEKRLLLPPYNIGVIAAS